MSVLYVKSVPKFPYQYEMEPGDFLRPEVVLSAEGLSEILSAVYFCRAVKFSACK